MLALDDLCKLVHNNIREAIATDKIIQAQLTAKLRNHSKELSPNGWPNSQMDWKPFSFLQFFGVAAR